jgi:ATP-dependent Clp protease ATP-binding subunit ClpC
MFYFNLKETAIYKAVKWEKCPLFGFAKPLKKLLSLLFLVVFPLFLYGFLPENFSLSLNRKLLGFSLLSLVFAVIFWSFELFLESKLKKPKLKTKLEEIILKPGGRNLAEFLSFDAAKGVKRALKFCQHKGQPEINSSALFYFLLPDSPKLNFVFSRLLLDLREIRETLKTGLAAKSLPSFAKEAGYSVDFQNVILESLKVAQRKEHQRIELGDLIAALAKYEPFFKKILVEFKLKIKDIENLTWWLEDLEERLTQRKRFWEYENLMKKGTLAKEWTAGYTITLDNFSIDLTELIRKNLPQTIGHQQEIKAVERILSREEINNVLLVGETGTGRKSIIRAICKNSLLGKSLPRVNYRRVVQLDIPQLLAQLPSLEAVEKTLDRIFQEAILSGNVILVIDEFHNFIGQIVRPGVIDISGILSPYLRLPNFQIMAITNFDGLHRYIEQNPSVLALFEKVEVSEISARETLILLENLTLNLERKYKRFISYPALSEIISLTERYMPALPFPEKAMELLEELIIYVAQETKDKIVLPSHVAKIITQKTQIPVGEIELKERQILLNLEKLIHQKIINQEEAVKEVSTAMRRARAEVSIRKGPMGCFLFLGPTGVGKTESSKALAEIYFGSEDKMIRLDMSEFQSISDIPRLLGSPGQEGLLTTPVRENPFSLILLDEIEKAHPNILNLFLQVLDEGHLTDGQGRKVIFRDSIIIATSNAGYKVILEALKKKTEWSGVKQKLLDFLFQEGTFRPEFINRFDAVVVFKPLSKENLLDIAELLLQKLKANLFSKGIEIIITEPLKEKIAELGYSPVFGAREMRRVIQDKVENPLASGLLSGQLKRGNRVEIDPKDFKLKINP